MLFKSVFAVRFRCFCVFIIHLLVASPDMPFSVSSNSFIGAKDKDLSQRNILLMIRKDERINLCL